MSVTPEPHHTPSVSENIRQLVSDVSSLIRDEITLAKVEMQEKGEALKLGAIALVSGLLVAFCALIILLQALVIGLGNLVPPSVAALIVGVILTLIALILFKTGVDKLSKDSLTPHMTIKTTSDAVQTVKDRVS